MAFGSKYTPYKGINLDVAESLMPPDYARYIKNLVYSFDDTSDAGKTEGGQTGVWKPLQSNTQYIENFELPDGENHAIGTYSFKETKQVFVFVFNDRNVHTIYRLNGTDGTFNIVYQKSTLKFTLSPEHFIHKGGCWLELVYISDPNTGEQIPRSFLMFTDGKERQHFIAVEDSIATNGFDPVLFPYFQGNYDPEILISMGVPTPKTCIQISEVTPTVTSEAQNNKLLYNTWQFRIKWNDVWGRPSEYSIISDMYIPANDCISASSGIARCLDLLFDAPPPYINQVEVAYRNCNSQQWYTADVLDLYIGSPLGEWWLRPRNPKVNFNSVNNTITYQFCADKECQPIAPANTNRNQNPLPRTSQSVSKIGKFIQLANNKDGFLPFSQELKDKITFTVEPPQQTAANNLANIEIFVQVYNPLINLPGGIFKHGDKYNFGVFDFPDNPILGIIDDYAQYFANKSQTGFIGYFAGTNVTTISEQYSLDPSGNLVKVTDFEHLHSNLKYFQKFTFNNVPRGIKIFRIAGVTVDPAVDSVSTIEATSTHTAGLFGFNISNPSNPVNNSLNFNNNSKELIIDVCNGNYSSLTDNKILVIYDFTAAGATVDNGYVKNTNDTTQTQFGVELLKLSGGDVNSVYTDHNGYFFVAGSTGLFSGYHYFIYGYCNCQVVAFANRVNSGQSKQQFNDNYFLNQSTACPNYNLAPCNFILIKGKVTLCGKNIGVPNISVVLSRGASATTDADGNFTIIAHDDVLQTTRNDSIYFNTNVCSFTDCNGGCVQPIAVTIQKCVVCGNREIDVPDTAIDFKNARGLLSGGVYPVSVTAHDWLGRDTFLQDEGYITIPSVQQTGIFAPSRVRANIDPNAIFPDEFEYLTFSIGSETTIEDYITWIADNVEFIDNTGLVNNTSPTQIKIFYSSLVEYNKHNNFNTTVNWNFLEPLPSTAAAGTTQTPFTNDKVEFLINGDGTLFPKAITALVKYDQTGQFFLIDYTADLQNLKANAVIRLIRPKVCVNIEPSFEVCFIVDLKNGRATQNSFYLNFFDTYYLYRQIPVPTLQTPVTDPPVFFNEIRILGVPFEHNSPSDFWGQGCKNIGRDNVKNPYETVVYSRDQIALSGAFTSAQLNFLNYFDDANKKDFSDAGTNGIVSVITKPGIVLVIGQSDNFVVGFDDNLARINSDGTLQVASAANQFGQPQRKTEANYGCLLFDKNTIYEKDGLVQFLDTTKSCLVQHNFQYAISVSEMNMGKGMPGGVDSWLRPKIKFIQQYNLQNGNKRYWHGIVNPASNGYLLTDFIIGSGSYSNTLRQEDITVPETMEFNIKSRLWKGAYEFVPEFYAELEGELTSQQLFSFVKGIAYSHYNDVDAVGYGTIYGNPVNRTFDVIVVIDNLKKKKPLSAGVICKQSQYFADKVTNEQGQETRMLLEQFIQADYTWFSPVLCDLNTPADPNLPVQTGDNKLMDGDMLIGNWIRIRFIGNPANDADYSELQGVVCSVFGDGNNLLNQ